MMALGSFSFTVAAECDGMSARHYLRRVCGLTARSMTVLKYAEAGGITRGGAVLRSCETVHTGDRIDIRLPRDENDVVPVQGTLDILYEDDCLLIVNKPAAMPVHPTKVHQNDTLANIVSWYQQEKGEVYTFRALNRLDKDTSGIVIVAKDRLSYAMTLPTIHKRYVAVCEGIILGEGTIDAPMALEPDSKIRRCISPPGQRAVTHYQALRHGNAHTMLGLWLETGRTHQIRCHMSSLGHPLAGDDLYGGSRRWIGRQALHCVSVTLRHPRTKEELQLETQIPPEFTAILEAAAI